MLSNSLKRFPDSSDAAARTEKLEQLRRESKRRVTSAPVENHTNAVEFCDKIHSTWVSLYLSGNCLRRVDSLDDEDFLEVEKLVLEERRRRVSQ